MTVATAMAAAAVTCSSLCSYSSETSASACIHTHVPDSRLVGSCFVVVRCAGSYVWTTCACAREKRASIKVITSQGHGKMPTPPFLIYKIRFDAYIRISYGTKSYIAHSFAFSQERERNENQNPFFDTFSYSPTHFSTTKSSSTMQTMNFFRSLKFHVRV